MARIAFIGLGNMGGGMAARLAGTGQQVVACDLSPAAVAAAVAAGCQSASSASETVGRADAVITMLPAGEQVRSVYDDAILPYAAPDALLIDCSTTDVETARSVGARAAAAGLRFADAPVSGGTAGANAGTLAFMAGCAERDFAAIQAVVAPMARSVVRAGDHGAGQAAKICNNLILGASMAAVCEAFALAEKLGLDAARFFEIASQSSGQCWSLTSYCPWPGLVPAAPANRDYEAGFATAMMLKDLRLAQQAAASVGARARMSAEAERLFALSAATGRGGQDFSALLELFRTDATQA